MHGQPWESYFFFLGLTNISAVENVEMMAGDILHRLED